MSFRHAVTRRAVRRGALGLWIVLALLPFVAHRGGKAKAQALPSTTLTFNSTADTYVDSGSATKNFNSSTILRAAASPTRITYLRFAVTGVSGRQVQKARLRLGVSAGAASGGTVHLISNNTWSETAVTFNTRPTVDGSGLQTLGAVTTGATVEFTLDGAITADGTYNLAIDSSNSATVGYNSSLATSGQKPQLVLTVAAQAPTVTIAQPPTGASYFTGDAITLQASAHDSASVDLSTHVAWSSNLAGPLGTGAVVTTSLGQGTHTITAAVTDSQGLTGSSQISVTVTPPPPGNTAPLVTITAPTAAQTLASSAPITFTGSASDLEDGDLTAAISWTSDRDGALGTGGSVMHTLSDGTHQITATVADRGGLTATTTVSVQVVTGVVLEFPAVADASVDAGLPTTNFGTSPTLAADASLVRNTYLRFDVSGLATRTILGAVLRLQVDATPGAESDSGGVLHTITDGTWQENAITFNNRPQVDGPTVASQGPVALGQTVDFNVASAVTGDGTFNFAIVNTSADECDYRSREGGPAPKLMVTVQGNPPTVTISSPADGSVHFRNQTIAFAAQANDAHDGDLSSQIQWMSSRDGALGTGPAISTSTLSAGAHVITAAATDVDGLRGQAMVSIRVRDPNVAPVVTISAPTDGTSVPAGTTVSLAATATDDFDGNVTSKVQWASSRDGALGGGGTRTVTLSAGSHVLVASVTDSDGATGSAQVHVTVTPTPPVVTITGPPDGTTVFLGTSLGFTGTANDATDGNLSASLRWFSDRDGLIGSGASFTTTRLSAGTHVITAQATDRGGLTGRAQRTVIVRPPNTAPAVSIAAPVNGTALITGKPVLLAATATDAEDGDLAAAVSWRSSLDGALGTGGALVVPGLSVGTHTLTASATDRDGATTAATVTVTIVPTTLTFAAVADTYVDASKPTSAFGTATSVSALSSPAKVAFLRFPVSGLGTLQVLQAKLRLTAVSASNSGGIVKSLTNNTWSEASTNYNTRPTIDGPTLATQGAVAAKQVVDLDVSSGVHGDGTYNFGLSSTSTTAAVYQSREAASGQPQLILTLGENQAPFVRITAPPSGSKVLPGAAVTFTGAATDAENGNLSSQIQWSSSLDGPLGTGASFTVSSLRSGVHTITARVADAGGLTAQAQITLNVLNTPVVRITAPANGAAFFAADGPITLSGSATDVEDGNLSGRLQWNSDRDGALASGATILASQLSIGTHTITAMVIDDDGLHGQASISIRVRGPNQPPQITITSPANGSSVPAGTPTALTATVTDDFDTNLAGQVRWTSDRDGALGTGPRTVTLSEGSHVLTASVTDSNSANASAQVRVTIAPSAPVVTITAPAAGTRVFAGTNLSFSGTAIDATDGNLTAGLRWTSDRDGAIGSGPSFSTSRLSIGTHTITAAATDRGGLVGQAPLTLIIRGPNVPPVVQIVKPADGGSLLNGKPVLLEAMATDAEDGDLGAGVRWTSNLDGALGTGSLLVVPSLSLGTHTLTAVVTDGDGATGTATITVFVRQPTLTLAAAADTYVDASAATTKFGTQTSLSASSSPVKQAFLRFAVSGVGSLAVQSAHLKITAGSTTASASTSGGVLHAITDNTWSEAATTYNNRPAMDGPTLGTQGAVAVNQVVDFDVTTAVRGDGTYNFGLLTTAAHGVIYNSREAASKQPQLVVTLSQNQTPAVTITAPASGTKVRPGAPVTFSARALDAENGDLSSQIQWRSDVDGALGTGASISVSTLSPGSHTIIARVTDASGLAAQAQITIVVAHPPIVSIASPPDGSVYFLTDLPVTFTGVASDVEDGDLSAKIQWSSDLAGALGTGATVSAASLAIGTHTITATVTDADGLQAEAQINVRVRGPNAPPQISITAPRDGAAVPAGTTVQLAAAATDDFDGDLSGQVQWTSSRDGALFRGASKTLLLTEGSHVLTASITDSDGASTSAQVHVTITPTPPVVTITAPPMGTRVFVGTSVTFTATAIDATDGNVGSTLRWISNLDGPIGTGSTFSTTRLSAGTHTITAIATDTGGLLGRAQATVVIRPLNTAPVVTIISPADRASLLVGKPVVVGATALDTEDGDLSPTIRWTSSRDGALGTGPTVLRSSLSAGTHTLTATVTDLDGATGSASITVNVVPATITFTPIADTYVDSGVPTKLFGTATGMQAASSPVRQAFLRFQVTGVAPLKVQQALVRLTVGPASTDGSVVGGTLRTITNNTWSEAATTYNTRPAVDGAVLTTKAKVLAKQVVDFDATSAVTGDGTYNFALVSSSTDWVTYVTREASSGKPQLVLTLAQNTAPVIDIMAPAPNSTVNIGAPVTFKGTATDAESGDLSSQIQWTSSLDGTLGTGATLTVARLQPGTHVITARVTDPSGLAGQAQITLNVGHKPNVTITSPVNRTVFYLAQGPITFTATASDFEDGNLSGRLRWTSDRDGSLGTGSSVTRSLTLGTHTITTAVTDVNGNVGQAQIIVKVRGPNVAPVITITAPQDNSSAPADRDVTLTATANDDFDGDLSSLVQWTSSRQGALFTGASKAVRLREGQHTITAAVTDSDGATSTAQITVIITPTPPAVTITSPQDGSTVTTDASTSFNAAALDATDGDLASTIQWTSDRDGALVTGPSFATNMLSAGTHRITASATDTGGLVGSATITLNVIRIPAVAILLPQANDGYLAGNTVTFFATATDRVDGDVASSLVWTSDRDGQIGTGTTFTTTNLSVGAHTITAKATNSAHNDGSSQVSIVVHVASLSFDPIADTYVDELFPTTAFGAANELDAGSSAPTRKNSFLRFAVAGIGTFPVLDAKLQLTVLNSSTADGGSAGQVNSLSSNSWTEGNTTWTKQPTIDGPVLGANPLPVVQSQHVEIDLGATSVRADGTYNFALTSPSSNAAKYESRESLTVTNRPHLVVLLGQPATRRLPQVTITAPAGTSFFDDQPVTFTATARDDRDGDVTSAISWRSSIDGALGTGGSVTAATLHRGMHTITATVRNSTGLTGVATLQLTVTDRPPAVTITAPQDGRLFPVHFAATFTATATDNVDGDLGASLVWTSDRDGRLGTGRSITTSSLSVGDHRITASVTNSLGTAGSASITVTVGNGAPKVTLSAPADGTGVNEGTTVTLTATATDPEDGDLTPAIAWASDLQGALGTGGSVSFQFTVPGVHHITATAADSGAQTRAASVTLTVYAAAPVLTIVSPADGFSTSGSVTLTGTAIDFKDGDRSSTIRWSSNVAGALGTGATVTAARLASGRHVITASVTDSDGLTATKTITIGVGNAAPRVTITQPLDGSSAPAGTPLTFQATAIDGIDGNVTARISWVSDLNGAIGTGGSIATSTLARGTHVITAQVADSSGLTGSAFVIVTITPGSTSNNRAPQVTISAPGSGAQLPVGSSITFTGTAIDEAGDLSANLAWVSSLDGVIGTGRSFTTSSLSAGTHRIMASVSDSVGLVGSATIAVTVSGGGISFPAAADAYTDGGTANQSTNFGTATFMRLFNQPVDRIYLRFTVSGLPPGPVARAIVRLTTSSAVNAGSDSGGEIHTVSTPWDELTINHLNKPALDAAVLAAVAGPIVPSQTVDYDVSAAVTGNGTYDFGLKTLSIDRAEFVSREGGTGAPQLIIFRDAPTATNPSVHITGPADGTMITGGAAATFTATATDPQDGNISSSLSWRSDRDGVLGTGPSVSTTLSLGPHVITATARDSAGTTGADLIHVTVGSGAPTVNIAAPANTGSAVFGQPVAFIGSASDMPDGDLSFNLQWTSSIDGPIGTGPSFITRLSAGTHTITATVTDSDHNTGTASISFQVTATRVGYEDFAYGPSIEVNLDKATATKPQSKLWFNDGVWWGVLFNTPKSEYHIYRMDIATQTWIDTGVAVDNRGKSRADCLWDGQNQKLYVASRFGFGVTPPQNRLYRFTYFPGAQTYALDAGFPVNIDGATCEALTIAKDSTGMLWITYAVNGQVYVNHTIGGDDTQWSAPFFLPAPEGNPATPNDDSAVEWLPGNPGKIGVLWGNQSTQKFYFMVHGDGTPPENPASWKFEIAAAGSAIADDHMNMKVASDGRVFAAVKTSRTTPGQTLVGLLVRSVDGTWTPLIKVTNIDFDPTRPNVVLDEVNRKVYVFYASFFSDVYYKASDMDALAFPDTTVGTPLMVSGTHPVSPSIGGPGGINNVTTTKQVLDPSNGILVLASTSETDRYWHGWIEYPKPVPVVTVASPADNSKVRAGAPVIFSGTATSGTDGVISSSLKWTSSRDGQIGTGAGFTTSGLSAGVHTITASATDSSKLTGSAELTLTVEADAPPVVTITSPNRGNKFRPGQPATFTGTAIDSIDGDRTSAMVWTSDRDGQIGTGGSFTRSNLSLGHHTITARAADAGSLTGSASITIDVANVSAPVLTLTAPVDGRKFAFGAPIPFAATATDTFDGDLSARILWTSNLDGAVGTGGSFNRATLSRGTHTLTASITDSAGLSASATTHVTVLDDAPPAVTISAPTRTLFADGKPVTFTATAVDTIDGDRSSTLTWTSSRDGAIGTGASFTTSSLSVGVHTITASATDLSNLAGMAQITVEIRHQPAPTVAITAPADNSEVLFAQTATFTATATDTIDGDLGATIRWTSDRDGALGTGPSITARSLSLGLHTITASATNSGTLTGSAQIHLNVASGPQIVLLGPPDLTVVGLGDSLTFSAIAFDFEDGDLSSRLTWTSSRDGVLGTGASLTTSALSRGVHTITVSATDADHHTASVQLAVEIVARPTVIIAAPATGALYKVGDAVSFVGFASDPVDGSLTGSMAWTSSLDGALGTGGSLTVTTLRSGTHTITAQATNRRGLTGQKTITIVVNDPPVVTITAPADGARSVQGTPVTLSATASDREDGKLDAAVSWTSSRDGALGTGSSLTLSTLSAGVHTLTASVTDSGGRTASASRSITVSGRPAITITTPLSGARFNQADVISFTAAATDPEDGNVSSTTAWTSDRDGTLGTGGTITHTLSVGPHTITARATDRDGNSGQAQVTITVNAPPTVTIASPADHADFGHAVPVTLRATASDPEDGTLTPVIVWTSSRDGALGTGGTITMSTLSSGTHVITAAVADSGHSTASASITITVNGGPVVSITAPASGSSYLPGTAVSFTATASDFEDGDLTAHLTWSSSRDGALGAGGSITASALSAGIHTITASVSDSSGKPGSMQVIVTVNTPPVVTITAPSAGTSPEPLAAVTFAATATDAEDGNLATAIAWTSSRDGALGTGGTITTSGLSSGTHTITAAVTDSTGRTSTAQMTIRVNATPRVTITAPAPGTSPEPHAPITFTATALDAEDGDLTAGITWTSSRDGSLGTGGTLTTSTLSTGTHTIRATVTDSSGKQASATLTVVVNTTPTVHILTPADGARFERVPITFTGTASDPEDGDVSSTIDWASDRDGHLGSGATIVASLSSGTHVITASVTDAGGKRAATTITIVVNATPTVTISTPATSSTFEHGAPITFTGTASDPEDGNLSGSILWTSDRDGVLGTGFSVTTGTLSSGTHTITASATDSGNKTGRASITVVVNSTPTVTISSPTAGATFDPGAPVTLGAAASDLEDGSLTAAIAWTSSRDGSLGTGGTITTGALSTGTHVLTASATDHGGKTGHASIIITINTTPAITITAPANNATYELGAAVTLSGTATDVEDGTLTTHLTWTSSRDGSLGAGSTITTSTLTSGTHTITAAATDSGGKTGRASITITVNATPAVMITAPATGATFEPGAAVTFTGSASDTEDGDLSATIAWTSSRDGGLGTGRTITVSTLSTGTHTITATVTDSGGKTTHTMITITVDATPVVAITAPTGTTFEPGAAVTFTGSASDVEDGTLTSRIVWTSSRDGVLGTGATITVSTLSTGIHTITAAATDNANKTGRATITIAVNATPTVAITAPATGATLEPGAAAGFTATATDVEDGNLASALIWTSSRDGLLGTGAHITVSTLSAGTHIIAASATDTAGKTGRATITVTVNATPHVAITAPASGSIYEPGTSVTFTATATDAEDGNLAARISWISSRDGVLGTGGSITTSTLSSGTHAIIASVTDSGGKSASTAISVVVNATPTVAITAPASGAILEIGAATTLTATASDPEDGSLAPVVAWTSSRDGAIGTGGSITLSTLSAGTHVITASATDSGGKTGRASITITLNATPTVTITAPAAGSAFEPGAAIALTATATDPEDGNLASRIIWTSSRDGALGTGASLTVSTLSTGTHTITASATDGVGKTGRASITILVDATPALALTAPAAGSVFVQGDAITFTATATDAEEGDLGAAIHWTSSRDGALGTGASFALSNLSTGTHTITASVTDAVGRSASRSVTIVVDVKPTVTITAPTTTAYNEGDTIAFAGTASDPEDGDLTANIVWTEGSTTLFTGAGFSTSTLAPGSHTITASATDSVGKTSQTSVTVTVDGNPTVAITAPTTTTVQAGTSVTFVGTASDHEAGDLTGSIVWSNGGTTIATGPTFSATFPEGDYTITASATDTASKTATASITIHVFTVL